jgi:hypothetical protein
MPRAALLQSQNLLKQSEAFGTSPWSLGTGVTVTENTTDLLDPNGTMTASKIAYNGSGSAGQYFLYQLVGTIGLLRETWTLGIYLCVLSGTRVVRIDPNAMSGPAVTLTTSWQNVLVTGSANAGYGLQLALYRDVGDNAAGSIYAWGAHATKANRLGAYTKTTGAAVAGPIRNAKS